MFFIIALLFVPIVVYLYKMSNRRAQAGEDSNLSLIAVAMFSVASFYLFFWFVVLIERWRMTLGYPLASGLRSYDELEAAQQFLYQVAYFMQIKRAWLALFYASPFILIPTVFALLNRARATAIMIGSAATIGLFALASMLLDIFVLSTWSMPLRNGSESIILPLAYLLVIGWLLYWPRLARSLAEQIWY